ncbi:MAG: heavy-metal-associated domain-containing protein [Gammaproteobacteria bacterium]|nr:heavy-metal-associated domain-containing protein [Gammaproteobacteria bacterium]
METVSFNVANVKCGGCADTIRSKLAAENGVAHVAVDIKTGHVEVQGAGLQRARLAQALKSAGYPEKPA